MTAKPYALWFRFGRLILWFGFLFLTLVVLTRASVSNGSLLSSPTDVLDALRFGSPSVVLLGVLRWMAIGCSIYLLVATTLSLLARLTGAAHLIAWSDMLSPVMVRRLVATGVTISLSSGIAAASPAGALETSPSFRRPVPMLRHTTAPPPRITLPAEARAEPPHPPPAVRTHVVVTGDSFWSIAGQQLKSHGVESDPERTRSYWRVLIEANRHALVRPENPDFIVPGQQFILPPLP